MNGRDRNPVKEKAMSSTTINEQNSSAPAPEPKSPSVRAKESKKRMAAKKPVRAKKATGKPKTDRNNKKAKVIVLMERAKGATLAEIMAVTKWQAHTVRGFISILGRKGGEKIESSKSDAGERTYRIAK
jgi:uncharacterized protein DUF3489